MININRNIALLIEQSVNVVDALNTSIRLTDEEQLFICNHFERIELNKNDFLIKKGSVENYIYFIESGVFRYWEASMDNEKEITFCFSFSGEFAYSYLSLKNRTPSIFNIQSLCNSVAWRLDSSSLAFLYKTSLNVNRIMRVVFEDCITKKIIRELNLLKYTPEERYINLIKMNRELLQIIPLKYIASYIGITPQALSCIRKRIS